jgi:hypothetical protein
MVGMSEGEIKILIYLSFVSETHPLKTMSVGGKSGNPEVTKHWWATEDDLVFDTIGWQNVNGVKVLMCGDCEFGPVGLRIVKADGKTKFLVAVERVMYLTG